MEKTAKGLGLPDLQREAQDASQAMAADPTFEAEYRSLVSQTYLTNALFALWDSGFYEYVRETPRFVPKVAAEQLGFDPVVFDCLLEYLIGRGLMRRDGDAVLLTERGTKYTAVNVRGLLNLFWGGYQPLVGQLGPMLRREIPIGDPRVARSTRHAALGTEQTTSLYVTPAVLEIIHDLSQKGAGGVLDLGCGTGGFLIQLAKREPEMRSVGVDMSPPAVEQARRAADAQAVGDRLSFYVGEVGTARLPLPASATEGIGVLTAMFMLHEFGRHGPAAIARVLRALREQFAGRHLLFVELPRVDADAMGAKPPPYFTGLDYLFIHPLSGQGRPLMPDEWKRVVIDAGCEFLEHKTLAKTPVSVYIARL